jgi:hypothetical protein
MIMVGKEYTIDDSIAFTPRLANFVPVDMPRVENLPAVIPETAPQSIIPGLQQLHITNGMLIFGGLLVAMLLFCRKD